MKIIIAPDSFKECASSIKVCELMEQGVRTVLPEAEIVKIPIADGGEGTVDSILFAKGGYSVTKSVFDPMMNSVQAKYGFFHHSDKCNINNDSKTDHKIIESQSAIIEMAAASGLSLVDKQRRNPLIATTYGTGELIIDAIETMSKNSFSSCCNSSITNDWQIVVGLGGSATNDCGIGMAAALGYRFLDINGKILRPFAKNMSNISYIDTRFVDTRIFSSSIVGITDVTNLLSGPLGATSIFGKQKGVDNDETFKILDSGLENMARLFQTQFGVDVDNLHGAGAAGGLGAGLAAFCRAELRRGIDTILDIVDFDSQLVGASLVITGEGNFDIQSAYGKAPVGVAMRAQKFKVPTVVIAGNVGKCDELEKFGISRIISTTSDVQSVEESINKYETLIPKATSKVVADLFG